MPKILKVRGFHIFGIPPWGMKLIFCLQINSKVFLVISHWVCVARNTQSTGNSKFAISMKYRKKNVKDEVDFLPADKHQRFLEIHAIVLGVCGKACPNYPK